MLLETGEKQILDCFPWHVKVKNNLPRHIVAFTCFLTWFIFGVFTRWSSKPDRFCGADPPEVFFPKPLISSCPRALQNSPETSQILTRFPLPLRIFMSGEHVHLSWQETSLEQKTKFLFGFCWSLRIISPCALRCSDSASSHILWSPERTNVNSWIPPWKRVYFVTKTLSFVVFQNVSWRLLSD